MKAAEQGRGMPGAEVYEQEKQGKMGKECRLSRPPRFTSAQPANARNNGHRIAQTQRAHLTFLKVPSLMPYAQSYAKSGFPKRKSAWNAGGKVWGASCSASSS